RERVDRRRVEPEFRAAHQRLAGQLQQDAAERPRDRPLLRVDRLGDGHPAAYPSAYQVYSTSSRPPCSSAFPTVSEVSWIQACSASTDSAKKRLLSMPSTIFSRTFSGFESTSSVLERMSRSAVTSSGGTSLRLA